MMNSEKFVPQENELLLRRALAAEALLKSRKKQVGSCESFIIMLQPFGGDASMDETRGLGLFEGYKY